MSISILIMKSVTSRVTIFSWTYYATIRQTSENKDIVIMGDININLNHTDDKNTGNFLNTMFSHFYLTLQHPLILQETQKH